MRNTVSLWTLDGWVGAMLGRAVVAPSATTRKTARRIMRPHCQLCPLIASSSPHVVQVADACLCASASSPFHCHLGVRLRYPLWVDGWLGTHKRYPYRYPTDRDQFCAYWWVSTSLRLRVCQMPYDAVGYNNRGAWSASPSAPWAAGREAYSVRDV